MLTYTPEKAYSSYAQLIIRVNAFEDVVPMMHEVDDYLAEQFPQASIKFRRLEIGPSPAAKIEARFIGPDPTVLRLLAAEAKQILRDDPGATNIRDDWRERSKMIRPQLTESDARRLGISKQNLDRALLFSFAGAEAGLYRDGTKLKPIIARLPANERLSIDTIRNVQLYSNTYERYVKIDEVVSDFETHWEDALIQRLDRKRTLTVLADQDIFGDETANDVFNRVQPKIEAIEIPDGYALQWGGEYESSGDAQAAIFVSLPLGYLFMFIITVLLFNAITPGAGNLGLRAVGHDRHLNWSFAYANTLWLHGAAGHAQSQRHADQERHRAGGPDQHQPGRWHGALRGRFHGRRQPREARLDGGHHHHPGHVATACRRIFRVHGRYHHVRPGLRDDIDAGDRAGALRDGLRNQAPNARVSVKGKSATLALISDHKILTPRIRKFTARNPVGRQVARRSGS